MKALTKSEAEEVYYAGCTKIAAIKRGEFGEELEPGEDKKWIACLESVLNKIGIDGKNLLK